jgi:8-oxo-dGTP diphosphatase
MASFPDAVRFCPFCGGELGPPFGSDVAQSCTACGEVPYHSSKPAVGVVLARASDQRVLFILRRYRPYRGRWGLPSGFVTYGELPEDAAVREVREETGLQIRIRRLLGMWIERYPRANGTDRLLSLYYLAEPVGGTEQVSDEASRLAWFHLDKRPSRLAGQHLIAVLDAARGQLCTRSLVMAAT